MFVFSEVPKTDKSFEERLIIKTFVLKFANAFSPIVYLAFFRGRLNSLLLYLTNKLLHNSNILADIRH